jgi:hypothetical protein
MPMVSVMPRGPASVLLGVMMVLMLYRNQTDLIHISRGERA